MEEIECRWFWETKWDLQDVFNDMPQIPWLDFPNPLIRKEWIENKTTKPK